MHVSITRLHLRSLRYLPMFLWHSYASMRQVVRSPGFLGGKVFLDGGLAFWTLSEWTNESSMRSFRNSGAHKASMPLLFSWCDEASVVSWPSERPMPVSWIEAHRKILEIGHFTPVKHPSPAQQNKTIPAPLKSLTEYILKPQPDENRM